MCKGADRRQDGRAGEGGKGRQGGERGGAGGEWARCVCAAAAAVEECTFRVWPGPLAARLMSAAFGTLALPTGRPGKQSRGGHAT